MGDIREWCRRGDMKAALEAWAGENEGTGELFSVEQVVQICEGIINGLPAPELRELWVHKSERLPRKDELDMCRCVLAWHDGGNGANVYGFYGMRTVGIKGIEEDPHIRWWMALPGRPEE